MEGYVKSMLMDRGYGFIRTSSGLEYFFHREDFQGDWNTLVTWSAKDRVRVTFEGAQTPKGQRASFVNRLG